MLEGTSPPCRSTSACEAPMIERVFARKKPVVTMIGSMSAGLAAASARASGYFANRLGVTMFTRASVDCAERIVAINSSNGER